MSAADAPKPLTGGTAIYPYGVDTFSEMHNYESWEDGEQGHVISAAFRNRIADSIIRLEQDLVNVVRSDTGDMRIATCTLTLSAVKVGTTYYLTYPQDVLSFIFYDGAAPNNASIPYTLNVGIRPASAAKVALWSSATSDAVTLQYFFCSVGATQLALHFWDPTGKVAASPSYGGSMGDYIVSLFFMRPK